MAEASPPTILFVSHESKLYGAPLSLLFIIQWFSTRASVAGATVGEGGFVDAMRQQGFAVHVLPRPADYREGPVAKMIDTCKRQFGKISNAIRLARIAREANADLVYVNSVSRLSSIAGAWMSGRKLVVHVREVDNYLDSPSPARRFLLRRILRLPDRFIADSDASRQALLRVAPGADVVVVNNGVDPEAIASSSQARATARRRIGLDVDKTVVGFVGKRSLRKGFDVFMQAATLVRAEHDDFQVLVIGDVHESIPDPGSANSDLFELPFQDDVSDLYVPMDIFVMASRQEPFARVNLEAAAAGCAIVATDVDGNRELFTHEQTALLVPAGDAEAMAGAIERLVTDAELRRKLATAAQTMVREHYTLEACHEKILENIADFLPLHSRNDKKTKRPND